MRLNECHHRAGHAVDRPTCPIRRSLGVIAGETNVRVSDGGEPYWVTVELARLRGQVDDDACRDRRLFPRRDKLYRASHASVTVFG